MAAPSTTSAQAPEVEHSQMGLNEPSMEDILASIRRIIAEDQSSNLARGSIGGLTRRAAQAAAVEARANEPAQASVPDQMEATEPTQPSFEPEPHGDMASHAFEAPVDELPSSDAPHFHAEDIAYHPEPEPEQAYAVGEAAETIGYPMIEPRDAEPLMSPATGASITSSFHALAETMVLQDPELVERVMRDSMRPLLKAWLDDHLPSIVERLVRGEIERVARGGRGRNS